MPAPLDLCDHSLTSERSCQSRSIHRCLSTRAGEPYHFCSGHYLVYEISKSYAQLVGSTKDCSIWYLCFQRIYYYFWGMSEDQAPVTHPVIGVLVVVNIPEMLSVGFLCEEWIWFKISYIMADSSRKSFCRLIKQ